MYNKNHASKPGERWLPVPDFEDLYEVSDLGRVRKTTASYCCPAGYIMRGSKDKNGYPTVELGRKGLRKRTSIHRLVARAFIGPIPPDLVVNHIDGDKGNPKLDNLEIVSRREDAAHARRNGLSNNFGENAYFAKLTNKQVEEIRAGLKARTLSFRKAAKKYGVCTNTIYRIASGFTWSDTSLADTRYLDMLRDTLSAIEYRPCFSFVPRDVRSWWRRYKSTSEAERN